MSLGYDLARDRALPRTRTSSEYTFKRTSAEPGFIAHYAEVVPIRAEGTHLITAHSGNELTIPSLHGEVDVVGRMGEIIGVADFGAIFAWNDETNVAQIEVVPSEDVTGRKVAFYIPSPLGGTDILTETAEKGREWSVAMSLTDDDSRAYLLQLLATAHVTLVLETLGKCDELSLDPSSPTELLTAVQALAAEGVNLETIIWQGVRQIDMDRETGNLPESATISPDAPNPFEL